MGKLNPLQVRNLKEPGRYSDGDGLILEVRPREARRAGWRDCSRTGGGAITDSGSFKDISLKRSSRESARVSQAAPFRR